ncbi:hypothetical protein CCR75_006520 [Bremia lactucae]|uniref:3-deoxy-D-manno-octulosonic-acid transferase N-terminal domain-containing protein n=1 Tax=Bremia lactucae TaxID=4779 RepID=A0A976FPK7_BRELC|nr:hypothetical protein CCR75_006520 [Bremia lactucae]
MMPGNQRIWIESEIWPTLISEAAQRGIRIGLVNGRMSAQSFRLWQLPGLRKFSKSIVGLFTLVICQDEHNRRRFELLGAQNAFVALNLKLASIRLNSNANKANALRSAIGSRPAWVAASTHTNEEVMMTEVHFELSKRLPKDQHLLTLIIPRHPHRTSVIIKQLYQKRILSGSSLKSQLACVPAMDYQQTAQTFSLSTQWFNTLKNAEHTDETSLIYDCISTAVIGGSFIERGGHNPIEPLRAGCYVLTGPHMENFETLIYQLNQWLSISEALRPVANSKELVVALADRLTKLQYSSKDSTPACPSSARTRQMRAMGCLAESTISLYQRHLIKWLAKDAHVMVHSESIKK